MTTKRQKPVTKQWQSMLAIIVVILAMGLRFHQLDTQSFWNDEGNTARLVERPIALIIEGAAGDIHPPGYYLLLHLWRAAVGHSEFALRSYSAFCGVAMTAVALILGRKAGGWVTGLIAGMLVAIHPLAIYYSQEARMYAQLGLVTALTLWAATTLVKVPPTDTRRRTPWKPILALAACVTAGLYTQYTYSLALVGLSLAFGLLWLIRRPWNWRLLAYWILAHMLGSALFAPWAPIALGAAGWQPPDLDQGEAVLELARTLVVGITRPPVEETRIVLIGGMLLLSGVIALAASRHNRRRFIGWAAAGMAIVPGLIIAAAGIYRPAYLKFLMMSVVPLAIVWALPVNTIYEARTAEPKRRREVGTWLLRGAATVLLVALVVAQAGSLVHLYSDPAFVRDDYRTIAERVRALGQPGDAIILNAPNQWEVFTYYYGASADDTLPVYPAPYRPTRDEAVDWVTQVIRQHPGRRLFVLSWGDQESDPERYIETALVTHAFKAGEIWITSVRFAEYGSAPNVAVQSQTINARIGEHVTLVGYSLPATALSAGEIVPLTLIWETEQALEERLKVFVHLLDNTGALKAQVDLEPQAGFAPTSLWQPGDQVMDHYGLALPADLTPGTYTLQIGMYRTTGERLPIYVNGEEQGDALRLAAISVVTGD